MNSTWVHVSSTRRLELASYRRAPPQPGHLRGSRPPRSGAAGCCLSSGRGGRAGSCHTSQKIHIQGTEEEKEVIDESRVLSDVTATSTSNVMTWAQTWQLPVNSVTTLHEHIQKSQDRRYRRTYINIYRNSIGKNKWSLKIYQRWMFCFAFFFVFNPPNYINDKSKYFIESFQYHQIIITKKFNKTFLIIDGGYFISKRFSMLKKLDK